jgi:hypothetical protein
VHLLLNVRLSGKLTFSVYQMGCFSDFPIKRVNNLAPGVASRIAKCVPSRVRFVVPNAL